MRSKPSGTIAIGEALVPGARILPFRSSSGEQPAVAVVAPAGAAPVKVELTLEQYASLAVELGFWPQARAATLARYGLADEDAFKSVDAAWTPRIAWEPGVVARWSEACRAYRSWLVEHARTGQ